MDTSISLTVTYLEGDSSTVLQVDHNETVENVKALVEAMVLSYFLICGCLQPSANLSDYSQKQRSICFTVIWMCICVHVCTCVCMCAYALW